MEWMKQLFYGLVTGLSGGLPISSQAHQELLSVILGLDQPLPLLHLMLDGACLLALLVCCHSQWKKLRRDSRGGRRAVRSMDGTGIRSVMTLRFLKAAAVVLLLTQLLSAWLGTMVKGLQYLALFLAGNGIFLFLPQQLPVGNRDARTLSPLAAVLAGVAGGLSGIPGISGLAGVLCAAQAMGTSKSTALSFAYLLAIPALMLRLLLDAIQLAGGVEAIGAATVLFYFLAAAACYAGMTLAVFIMRSLSAKTGFSGFAFYSWGAAMLAVVLYLTT